MFIGCCMSAQMRNAGMCVCVRVCLLQFFFFPKCCHILLHQIRVFGKLLQVTRHGANENFQPNAAKGLMHGPCEGLTQPHPCRKNSTPTEKKQRSREEVLVCHQRCLCAMHGAWLDIYMVIHVNPMRIKNCGEEREHEPP